MPNDKKNVTQFWDGGEGGRGREVRREKGRSVCMNVRIISPSSAMLFWASLQGRDCGCSFGITADFLYPFHWFNCQTRLETPLQTYQEILFLRGVCITLNPVKQAPKWTRAFDKRLFMIQDPDQLFLPLWTHLHQTVPFSFPHLESF